MLRSNSRAIFCGFSSLGSESLVMDKGWLLRMCAWKSTMVHGRSRIWVVLHHLMLPLLVQRTYAYAIFNWCQPLLLPSLAVTLLAFRFLRNSSSSYPENNSHDDIRVVVLPPINAEKVWKFSWTDFVLSSVWQRTPSLLSVLRSTT